MPAKIVFIVGDSMPSTISTIKKQTQERGLKEDEDYIIIGDGDQQTIEKLVETFPKKLSGKTDTNTLFVVAAHGKNVNLSEGKKHVFLGKSIADAEPSDYVINQVHKIVGHDAQFVMVACHGRSVIKFGDIEEGIDILALGNSKDPLITNQGNNIITKIIHLKSSKTPISNWQIFKYLLGTTLHTFGFLNHIKNIDVKKPEKDSSEEETRSSLDHSIKISRPGKLIPEDLPDSKLKQNADLQKDFSIKRVRRSSLSEGIEPDEKLIENLREKLKTKLSPEDIAKYLKTRSEKTFPDTESISEKELTEVGLKPDKKTDERRYITDMLHTESFRGNIDTVSAIIEQNPEIINNQDESGLTALIHATSENQIEVIQNLIQCKTKINLDIQSEDGWTALMFAAQDDYSEVTQILLENNANSILQNSDGLTALMIATLSKSENTVKTLIQFTKEPEKLINFQNASGQTSLMQAAKKGYSNIVNDLIEAGANLEIRNNIENSALDIAILNNNFDIAVMLISHGAKLSKKSLGTISGREEKKEDSDQSESLRKLKSLVEDSKKLQQLFPSGIFKNIDYKNLEHINNILKAQKEFISHFDAKDEKKGRSILARILIHAKSDQPDFIKELIRTVNLSSNNNNLFKEDEKKRNPLKIAIQKSIKNKKFIPVVRAIAEKMLVHQPNSLDNLQEQYFSKSNNSAAKNLLSELRSLIPIKSSDFTENKSPSSSEKPKLDLENPTSEKFRKSKTSAKTERE